MFKRTTATNKVLSLKRRTKIIQGGTSASKTYSILAVLIDKALKNTTEISVVAETIPHLRRGALKDFLKIMRWTNRYIDANFNKSLLRYEFANGSVMEFFSADDASKLRGARRDVLYINECNNVTFEAYNELSIRTKREVFLDFNPANEFWVHTELKDELDSDFIILTYKDNEALDQSIIDQIEKNKEKAKTSSYWANWWNVYGLGQIGSLEGVIFNNWKQIDTIPNDAKLLGTGIDFGYTNDPTAIIEVYKWNNQRILNEICYQTQLSNAQISKYVTNRLPCYCDSAEPKSIAELRRLGLNATGVKKGADSINFGIQIMQEQDYLITKSSINLINEFRKYSWDKDKRTGSQTNKPIDMFNHAMDAVRYHEMETIGIKTQKTASDFR